MGFLSGQRDPALQGQIRVFMADGHHLGEKGYLLPGGSERLRGARNLALDSQPGLGLCPPPGYRALFPQSRGLCLWLRWALLLVWEKNHLLAHPCHLQACLGTPAASVAERMSDSLCL